MMFNRYRSISVVWFQRPLNWFALVPIFLLFWFAFDEGSRWSPTNGYTVPRRPTARNLLRNATDYLEALKRGSVDEKIEGLDFRSVGTIHQTTRDGKKVVIPFSTIESGIGLFPNISWIQFDVFQWTETSIETLSKLEHVRSLFLNCNRITDADLDKIATFKSLEFLQIETMDFSGSLQKLGSLPNLKKLVLTHGSWYMTDSPVQSLFARDVLADVPQLKSVEELVLQPKWVPGIAYFAGSKEPDPACDSILKKNAAELLKGHPSLRHLWIGSQHLPEEFDQVRSVAQLLPSVSVEAATYDRSKLMIAFGITLSFGLAFMLLGLNLTSQFSTPQSVLMPGYAMPHQRFAYGFLVSAVVAIVFVLSIATSIHSLALISLAMFILAFVMFGHVCSFVLSPKGVQYGTYVFLTLVVLICSCGFSVTSWPSVGLAMDRFFMGLYPTAAISLAAISMIVTAVCVSAFRDQHRYYCESSWAPSISLDQIRQNDQCRGAKFKEQSVCDNRRWFRSLERTLPIAGATRSWWQMNLLWQLGGGMFVAQVRFMILFLTLFTCFFAWIRIESQFMTIAMVLGMMIQLATIASAIVILENCTRRKSLSMEVLFPSARVDLIRHRFASMFIRLTTVLSVVYVLSMLLVHFGLEPVTGIHLMRSAGIAIITAGLLTGIGMWVALFPLHVSDYAIPRWIFNMFLMTASFAVYVVSIMLMLLIFSDGHLFPNEAARIEMSSALRHPAIIPGIGLLAFVISGTAYRFWGRAEFS